MRKIFKSAALLCMALSLGLPSTGRAQWLEHGVPMAAYANTQNETQIISDGAGGAYIVWRDYRTAGNADIYMQRIDAYGHTLWADGGIPIAEGPSQQSSPAICMNAAGYPVVAYLDNANGNYDIFAQRVEADGSLPWGAGGRAVCTHSSIQGIPRIVTGAAGYTIISWMDSRNGNQDVFVQKINWNGVTQWATDGTVICNAADVQDEMQMVTDDGGGAILAWVDLRDGTNLLVYAQKISSTGFVQWTANGVRLSSSNCWQYMPQLISNGAGGATVTWYDDRNGSNFDIYAQRILTGGNVTWTSAGKYVCMASDNQYFPQLTTDGAGGAIITWQDRRNGVDYDVYAQRVNASGDAQWGVGGLAVSDGAGSQSIPCIVSDGTGGAIIAWQDQRGLTDYDIHAQRINGSGSPQWLMGGARACGAINNQTQVRIASDGDHGALLVWTDSREQASNGDDVYAQRMEKWGNWGYPAPVLTGAVDIPNDDGGRVMLTWVPSYLDAYPTEIVTHYSIWRSTDGVVYTQIDSMDAYYLDSYQYAAATTADSGTSGDATHWFKIRARTPSSLYWWTSQPMSCHSVDDLSPAPAASYLEQNYPNPFNPNTTISFGLSRASHVKLKVYDPAGRLVRTLIDEDRSAGSYNEIWDGLNSGGNPVSSGVYFFRLTAESYTETRKMVLLR